MACDGKKTMYAPSLSGDSVISKNWSPSSRHLPRIRTNSGVAVTCKTTSPDASLISSESLLKFLSHRSDGFTFHSFLAISATSLPDSSLRLVETATAPLIRSTVNWVPLKMSKNGWFFGPAQTKSGLASQTSNCAGLGLLSGEKRVSLVKTPDAASAECSTGSVLAAQNMQVEASMNRNPIPKKVIAGIRWLA